MIELFSNKFTNKITNNHITPFFILNKDIKSQTHNIT